MQAGGFALPGLPFVGLGYTDGVAWAGTAGGADSADVFELKTNPQNPDQYWYDDQWREMDIREVTVRVKTASGDDGRAQSADPRKRARSGGSGTGRASVRRGDLRCSRHAPSRTMAGNEPRPVRRGTPRCLPHGPGGLAQSHLRHARRSLWIHPDGDVSAARQRSLQHAGHRRRNALREANWQGRIPFDELPQLHDPDSGWLQSCNTAANYVTEGQSLRAGRLSARSAVRTLFSRRSDLARSGATVFRGDAQDAATSRSNRPAQFALETYAPAGPIWAQPLCAAYDAQIRHEFPTRT